jgi:hypothetical protein
VLYDTAGSTTVQPYDDETLQPIEVGASIYVRINKNMWRATDEFGLNRTGFGEESGDVGIWDGSEFVFIVSYLSLCSTIEMKFDTDADADVCF